MTLVSCFFLFPLFLSLNWIPFSHVKKHVWLVLLKRFQSSYSSPFPSPLFNHLGTLLLGEGSHPLSAPAKVQNSTI